MKSGKSRRPRKNSSERPTSAGNCSFHATILRVAVEQSDTLRHVVEHDAQGGLAAGKLLGALLDDLFEPGGRLGALGEELVKLDCVLSKHLDRPAHRRHLVRALGGLPWRARASMAAWR
jgi:hypothetical protein